MSEIDLLSPGDPIDVSLLPDSVPLKGSDGTVGGAGGTPLVGTVRSAVAPRPPRAFTIATSFGQSLGAGTGSNGGNSSLDRVAHARGLASPHLATGSTAPAAGSNNSVGGSVSHWPTLTNNNTNGYGGYASVLQALTATAKSGTFVPPFSPDGVSAYGLYQIMHGFNPLYIGGAVAAIPAEMMAWRAMISRCLSFFVYEDETLVFTGASGSGSGSWSAHSATDRNSGTRYAGTTAQGDYCTKSLQTSASRPLPPNTVITFGGWCQSADTGVWTFHDDTAGVTLGTLDLSTCAPPISVRTFTQPASGPWTWTIGGQTTTSLAQNATAATAQAALQALSSIGAGNAFVTGGSGGIYTITLVGTLAGQDCALTASAGTVGRIASPWVKRFVIGQDIPAYSINTIRATISTLPAGQSAQIDYLQFETPMPQPVVITNTVRPVSTNTYGFVDVATRDAAILTYNTALQAVCAEFNRPGLEAQALYVDLDTAFNKQAQYFTWSPNLGVGDGLHWGDDGHAYAASLIDAALMASELPLNDQWQRARGT